MEVTWRRWLTFAHLAGLRAHRPWNAADWAGERVPSFFMAFSALSLGA